MGISKLKLFQWVSFILFLLCACSFGKFVPIDNYLIDCGSSSNNSMGNLVFVSDNSVSQLLSTPENIIAIANTTLNSISSLPFGSGSRIYLTARIFNGVSVYTFPIQMPGRHWIRFHFFPFVFQSYNMSNAKFSVATQQFGLLNDFQLSEVFMIKEFYVNITGFELLLTFTPSANSFAFLNALEVVSVPDDAITINPNGTFRGLGRQTLETILPSSDDEKCEPSMNCRDVPIPTPDDPTVPIPSSDDPTVSKETPAPGDTAEAPSTPPSSQPGSTACIILSSLSTLLASVLLLRSKDTII